MYVYQEFPKCMYHPDKDPVIVQDAAEEEKLGSDWFDRPDKAQRRKQELAEKLSAEVKKLEKLLK